jgi:transcriptional regulator with XRE-family HTH domain
MHMKTIGPRILELRKRRGLTQEQLSDLSNINLRTLQRIEKGTSEPRSNTLKSLCQVLEVNMETLHLEAKTPNLNLIKYMHLSVLTCIFFPLGCIFFPAIIWFTNRN